MRNFVYTLPLLNKERGMVTAQIIRVVHSMGKSPIKFNSEKNSSSAQTITKLITKLERPSVRMRMGRVTRSNRGFKIAFSIPRISPASKSCWLEPVNSIPDTNRSATQSPAIPAKMCKRSACIIYA